MRSERDDTIDVLDTHRIDAAALTAFLARHMDDFEPPFTLRQFRGGQSNPTYLLSTPSRRYVLRRKPSGHLLPSAHAIEREFAVMRALEGTAVPVPRMRVLCEDASIIGTPFFVMSYVEGRPIADPALPDRTPADRRAIYASMGAALAAIHGVDWRARGLADFGRPGAFVERQVQRWTRQYRSSETETIGAMDHLIAWLPDHIPPDDETTLIHGDYRPGNVLLHPTEPHLVAVVDWELSTLGHPLVDLAHHALLYHTGPEDLGAFGDATPPEGIPDVSTYLAAYCAQTGRSTLPSWGFYLVLAMFRFAAIFQGIMGRVVAGTANDPDAARMGARARPLAERAWRLVESGLDGV
jgi:aminoglycoside phosphotransferase (APT) family kinase protein